MLCFYIGLKMAWCTVFICRIWWAWLQHTSFTNETKTTKTPKKEKAKYFITRIAYMSVEMNAQTLLYLIVLVKEKQLPKEALNIYLFNSQSCESMFRNTRALSGAFSTIINFTVSDFLRRSQKLSILNQIKHEQINNNNERYLQFPVHHKHKKDDNLVIEQKLDEVYDLNIEKIIANSYEMAIGLLRQLNITSLFRKK